MPFDFLVWECLVPGQTSIAERGTGTSARIKPLGGECVLTFGIDNQAFRGEFNVNRVCDALFFYKIEAKSPVLLFVELKGADIASAAEQVGQALQAVRRALPRDADYRAVVVTRRKAPTRSDALWRRFFEDYGVELRISRDGNLRPYL